MCARPFEEAECLSQASVCSVLTLVAEYPVVGGPSRAQRGGVRDEEEVVATASTYTLGDTQTFLYYNRSCNRNRGSTKKRPRCGVHTKRERI